MRQWVAESSAGVSSAVCHDPDQLQFTLIHAADRSVYRIDIPGTEQFLVLKIWSTDENGVPLKQTNLSILDEFEKTQSAYRAWSKTCQESYSMGEPVAVSESRQALLLTGCPGEEFSKYLNKKLLIWPCARAAIRRRFRGAGEWLAYFHSASMRDEDGIEYLDNRRMHLIRMLDAIQNTVSDPGIGRLPVSRFDDLINPIDSLPVVLIHGNYALRNLLVNDNSVSVIDFEESRRECSAFDVGQFVAEILVRGFLPTLSRGFIDRSVRDFLDGYSVLCKLDANLLDAYVGYHLVAFYFEHVRRKSLNSIAKLRRNHIRRELVRWLEK